MIQILIISSDETKFDAFIKGLSQDKNVEIVRVGSSEAALEKLSVTSPHLVLIDEDVNGIPGLKISRNILTKNAMVNQALVSHLSADDFHEASEGLGILAQLPPELNADHAKMLLDQLKKIL